MIALSETYSVCPVCLGRIQAAYVKNGCSVYLEKECGEHGKFSCLISQDADDFENWKADTISIKPKEVLRQTKNGCPHDCGPCEKHLQTACCVLIDLTDSCDQNCAICFASASPEKRREPGLSEIEQKFDELIRMSETRKFNIQFSGGEPTIRDELPEIITMAKAKGFEYVQLNTNGKKIGAEENYALVLKQAGLDAVFMQFDGMTDVVYRVMRNEELLELKKMAVENCRKARLPVALVPTIARGVNDCEIGGIIQFMLENVDVVKGIHFQPMSFFGRYPSGFGEERRFTMFDTINEIHRQTGGMISKSDLSPISTGHALCCFYANYVKQEDGSVLCTSAKESKSGCCCEESAEPEGQSSSPVEPCCPPDIEIISKDRDYVLKKWKMAETSNEDGFDAFLNNLRENSFTLTGMVFQDAVSLDTERLKRCRVQMLADGGGLIPFCAYNVTDIDGNYLYRP